LTEIYKQISVPAPTYGCDMFMPRKMWGHYYGASAPQHTDPRPVHGASDAAASDKIVAEHRMGANVVIHVIAIITAKPGMRGAILAAFQANMPVVRAEQGCIEYGPATDVEGVGPFQTEIGRDTFVVIEKWESAEALKARAASPHMDAYGAKTREMIASRVIYVLASA
jgi:quinol monooxygenase YgiN